MKSAANRMGHGAPVLGLIVITAMVLACGYAATQGSLWNQFVAIASIAWGQVLLVDLYAGFALFAGWIAWRDGHWPAWTAGWIIALLALGNVVAGVYVLLAWRASGGDARTFWLGERG